MTKHGMSKTIEYNSWSSMKARCYSENHKSYKDYGGKGITICEEWRDSFLCFLEDMGPRISKELTLDRIDPKGDYRPENCRWATWKEQANNKVNMKNLFTYKGETMGQASNRITNGRNRGLVSMRIKNGWSIEKAFTVIDGKSVTFNGETCRAASIRLGGDPSLVSTRIKKYGWDTERAFTEKKS